MRVLRQIVSYLSQKRLLAVDELAYLAAEGLSTPYSLDGCDDVDMAPADAGMAPDVQMEDEDPTPDYLLAALRERRARSRGLRWRRARMRARKSA